MSRTLVIAGDITVESTQDFLEDFAKLDAKDGPIEVRIVSNGGDLNCGMALYDAMQAAKNEVTTVGLGFVESAAVLVLQGGHKRLLSENAVLFLHETSLTSDAGLTQLKKAVIETERLHKLYCELIARRSGQYVETVQAMCKEETYVPAQLAQKHNFIDAILAAPRATTPRKPPRALRGRKILDT